LSCGIANSSRNLWIPVKLQQQQQQVRTKSTAVAAAAYDQSVDSFPSIVIGPNGTIIPQGTFAEAQAQVRFKRNDAT